MLDLPSVSGQAVTALTRDNVVTEPAAAIDALLTSLTRQATTSLLRLTFRHHNVPMPRSTRFEPRFAMRGAQQRPSATARDFHSTGQLHKGGPARCLSASDRRPQARHNYSRQTTHIRELNKAQSIGDFQSLVAHGRPVARFHLGQCLRLGTRGVKVPVHALLRPTRNT